MSGTGQTQLKQPGFAKPDYLPSELRAEATVSDFIRRISHEIGNPLTSIISLASVVEHISQAPTQPKDLSEKVSSYSRLITKEAWKIAALTHRLIHLVSDSSGVPSNCDIHQSLNNTLEHLNSLELGFTPRVILTGKQTTAFIDAEQLRTVLLELLLNCVEAIEELPAMERTLSIDVAANENLAEITFSTKYLDAPDCNLSELFKPFVSCFKKHKHLGLGLPVCWAILERFGGTIQVSCSNSTFSTVIKLPRGKGAEVEQASSSVESIATLEKTEWAELKQPLPAQVKILVIEDENTVATAVEKILSLALSGRTKLDCKVTLAEEALRLITAGEKFDAILCDLNLGPLMSGIELYSSLIKQFPEQCSKLAFLTGSSDSSDTDLYLATSGRPYLFKPFEPTELLRLVLELLEAK